MTSATLMLACALATPGAGPTEPAHMNQRDFQIPIRLEEARRADVAQVLLFALTRDGRRWEQVGAVTPDKEGFVFHAPEDGAYQFKVGVLGRDNRQDPADIYQAPVGQRVVVDTVRPELRIVSAERQGDEVVVRWELTEEHPDLASLRLDYRVGDGPTANWLPAQVTAPATRTATIKVNGPGPVAVRMQVQDLAQNQSRWAEAQAAAGTPSGPGLPSLPPVLPPGAVTPAGMVPPGDGSWAPTPPAAGGAQTAGLTRPAEGPRTSVVATASGTVGGTAPGLPRTSRPGLPALQVINKKQLTLEYEVAKFGASGVGSVELYVTRDDGATWQRLGGEEAASAPTADLKGLPASLKKSLPVEVTSDGVYGFYLIVKSGAGLGKKPPQAGDLPQMRVEVDTQAPDAKLFRPEPDPARRDTLLLRWAARDTNFGPTPITLQWSDRPGGEWRPLGGGDLPDTGQFAWQVPADVPHRVYLRLVVRDTAGNVSVAETAEPVLVDLNEPEVQSLRLGGTGR